MVITSVQKLIIHDLLCIIISQGNEVSIHVNSIRSNPFNDIPLPQGVFVTYRNTRSFSYLSISLGGKELDTPLLPTTTIAITLSNNESLSLTNPSDASEIIEGLRTFILSSGAK